MNAILVYSRNIQNNVFGMFKFEWENVLLAHRMFFCPVFSFKMSIERPTNVVVRTLGQIYCYWNVSCDLGWSQTIPSEDGLWTNPQQRPARGPPASTAKTSKNMFKTQHTLVSIKLSVMLVYVLFLPAKII